MSAPAVHAVPHLHLGGCVDGRCEPTCPRRGRPTGPDGRCACATCTDPHMRYGVTDVWENPGWPLVSRIVAAATDSEPTLPQKGDGVDDEVAGLIDDHEWRLMIGLADVMGLVGDWGTDDVEQAVIEAAHQYRTMTAGGAS